MAHVLFPELTEPEAPPVVAPVPEGRKLALQTLPTRTALVRQKPSRGGRWFDWSANPYRGCEFGCGYCYARYSHGYLGHDDADDFERTIYVKHDFIDALKRDLLKRVKPGEHVAFGTATDPYQPIEKREKVMRRALRALLRAEGLRLSLTTKSTLVARDAELLARLSERHAVHVNFSITTIDERLARFLEPRAPAPAKRLEALTALRRHGVAAGVFVMPLLPGVTDVDTDVDRLLAESAGAGALWLGSQVVFLREPSRSHFLRKLKLSYPRVAARYAWWTKVNARLPHDVRDEALGRLRRLATKHGLSSSPDLDRPTPRRRMQSTFAFSGEA